MFIRTSIVHSESQLVHANLLGETLDRFDWEKELLAAAQHLLEVKASMGILTASPWKNLEVKATSSADSVFFT